MKHTLLNQFATASSATSAVALPTPTLFDTIQRIVQEEIRQIRTAELAIVRELHPHASDSDADNYACSIELRNSGLLLKQVPVATQRIGSVAVPAEGELVLVQFIGGDINAPVIVGRLYNDEDRPPLNDAQQAILHLPLDAGDSDAVHIELHSGDRRELLIQLGSGIAINIRDDDPAVEIDVGGNAKVQIDSDGAITLESQGNVAMTGSEITIEAQGTLNLKGATVNIN